MIKIRWNPKWAFLLVSLIAWPSLAQMLLTEQSLIQMSRKENPRVHSLQAGLAASTAEQQSTQSQFDPRLSARYSYFSSKEDAIIQFIPVFQPQKQWQLGIDQKVSVGATIHAGVFGQQLSTGDGSINNATQIGAQLELELDIWKNFLGRLDQSELRSKKIQTQIQQLQTEIDQSSFTIDIRKMYWSLVSNEFSLQLSKQLVATAKKQFNEAKKKRSEGLGDSGVVARNKAQLESRKGSVLFFSYQKELLMSRLRSYLPDLKNNIFSIDPGEAISMEARTRQCMAQITVDRKINTNYTHYDEIVKLIEIKQRQDLKVADALDSPDIKLQASMRTSGVSDSHSEAFNELTDQYKNGYQVGVAVSIPLGGDLGRASESQIAAIQNQSDAKKQQLLLGLQAEHSKIKRAMQLLIQASQAQQGTVDSLRVSLKSTAKKYRQARVSLNAYILEQDNLFNTELQLIDTKTRILHLLLDYFKVFSKYPCSINQSTGVKS